ncbi:hypothetical protein HYV49_06395 [Candidatus Pacearchaeota archaeon]|nr:hypothetical protein [Candidatus Pacearchaeota archaeon]
MEHYKNLFITIIITVTIYLILFLSFQPVESGNLELHILIVIITIVLGICAYILLHRSKTENQEAIKKDNYKEKEQK